MCELASMKKINLSIKNIDLLYDVAVPAVERDSLFKTPQSGRGLFLHIFLHSTFEISLDKNKKISSIQLHMVITQIG